MRLHGGSARSSSGGNPRGLPCWRLGGSGRVRRRSGCCLRRLLGRCGGNLRSSGCPRRRCGWMNHPMLYSKRAATSGHGNQLLLVVLDTGDADERTDTHAHIEHGALLDGALLDGALLDGAMMHGAASAPCASPVSAHTGYRAGTSVRHSARAARAILRGGSLKRIDLRDDVWWHAVLPAMARQGASQRQPDAGGQSS